MKTTYHDFRCFDAGGDGDRYTIFPPRALSPKHFHWFLGWDSIKSGVRPDGCVSFLSREYHPTRYGKRVPYESLPKMVQSLIRRSFPESEWTVPKKK